MRLLLRREGKETGLIVGLVSVIFVVVGRRRQHVVFVAAADVIIVAVFVAAWLKKSRKT